MLKRIAAQRVHLQVTLHREHLGHRVRDRRAGGEDDTAAFVPRLDVLDLQEEIERAFGCSLRQSGDARHFRDVEQIFELVRFVDEEPVDAEFFERERVVFLLIGGERFEFRGEPLLHALQLFDEPRAAIGALLANRAFQFRRSALR